MGLIIETDLGHDPDDLFTILWLLAAGVDISAVVITPGDPDQLAVAHFIRDQTGATFGIGAAKLSQTELSSNAVHHTLLRRYGHTLTPDDDVLLGSDVIYEYHRDPTDTLLVIGPPSNVKAYLARRDAVAFDSVTIQGGFCPYSLYRPKQQLEAFVGKEWMPSFNPNGDRKGVEALLGLNTRRRIVGKNVCHTVVLEPRQWYSFAPAPNRAAELFIEAMPLLQRAKKFHDPVAAACHLYPDIGTWIKGSMAKRDAGWTTIRQGSDNVLVDLDRNAFWNRLYSWGKHA